MTALPGISIRIVVFAKAPQPGLAKTRLASALGVDGAAALARRMLLHALDQALAARVGTVELCMSPGPNTVEWRGIVLPTGIVCSDQGHGDLGQRMARAVDRVTATKGQAVLLMGTDCPGLTAKGIAQAARELAHHDAALVPVVDGGYVLIGLHTPCPSIFSNMAWSTATVTRETLQRLHADARNVWMAPSLHDIDEPADLAHLPAHWRAATGQTR